MSVVNLDGSYSKIYYICDGIGMNETIDGFDGSKIPASIRKNNYGLYITAYEPDFPSKCNI